MALGNALVKLNDVARTDQLIQLVSFNLGGEEYGIEVLKVREIIRLPSLTKTPNTAHFIEGIINLRGRVIPIISLRKRFNLPDEEQNSQTRIIIMDVAENLVGFIVDSVAEVIRLRGSEIQPPPTLILSGQTGVDQEYITGVYNHGERLLIIMDLDRIFGEADHQYLGETQF